MQREMIGQAAGAVWQRLVEAGHEGVTLTSLKKIEGLTGDQVAMGVGWLACEGKLRFETVKKSVKISLNESELACAPIA